LGDLDAGQRQGRGLIVKNPAEITKKDRQWAIFRQVRHQARYSACGLALEIASASPTVFVPYNGGPQVPLMFSGPPLQGGLNKKSDRSRGVRLALAAVAPY